MKTDAALLLAVTLLEQVAEIAAMIRAARAEGRDITDAELDLLASKDDAARAELAAAIAAARSA